jgi:lipopolysaccharide biosynthesis regulator YciM
MELPCMNCKKPTAAAGARVFDGVWVCAACGEIAQRTFDRIQQDLRRLTTLAKEAIRVAIMEGRLHLAEGAADETASAGVLQRIMKLDEERKNNAPR